jgi:hypothetical protein
MEQAELADRATMASRTLQLQINKEPKPHQQAKEKTTPIRFRILHRFHSVQFSSEFTSETPLLWSQWPAGVGRG